MQQSEFAFTKEENENNFKELIEWYDGIGGREPEEMAGFFTERLDGYEEHMRACFDDYKVIPSFLPKDTETLLDLGCGTGLELDEIFKLYPDIKVTGIDMAQPMLDALYKKHPDRDINLICGDYFKYDFGNECFDAAISVQSIHHFEYEKKGGIYKKIFDALKHGGVYIEADYTASSSDIEKLCLDFYHKQRARFCVPDDVFVHIDIPHTIEHRKELLCAAGFSRVDTALKAKDTVVTVAYK